MSILEDLEKLKFDSVGFPADWNITVFTIANKAADEIRRLRGIIHQELIEVKEFWDVGEFSISTIDRRTRSAIKNLKTGKQESGAVSP